MEYYPIARVVHVIAVILWIGGVAMVTTVILPSIKRLSLEKERIKLFDLIEGRFAIQAKITTLIAGLSGFFMLYLLDGWDRYFEAKYWWIHAMTLVWVLFSLVLYVLEPLVLHKLFKQQAEANPKRTFAIIQRAHWVLLILSLVTMAAAVAGSHGLFFI